MGRVGVAPLVASAGAFVGGVERGWLVGWGVVPVISWWSGGAGARFGGMGGGVSAGRRAG